MFEHVVAIIDGSETSDYVIGESIIIAREDGAKLKFCISLDPALAADQIGETSLADLATQLSERILDKALSKARKLGIPNATGNIVQGATAPAIVAFARAQNAGLIVLGMAPIVGVLRPFIRSLAEALLLQTTIPLCVVRRPERESLHRRILVPVVDDPLAHVGVTYAIRLARGFRSDLILLAIQEGPADQSAQRALDHATQDAARAGIATRQKLLPRDDGVSNAIARNAEVLACDAIVMATHMRQGFPLLVKGSVTEAVAYRSDVPVVIVRGPLLGDGA